MNSTGSSTKSSIPESFSNSVFVESMFLFISSLNCCKLLVNLELPAYAEDVPSSNVFKAFFTCAELLLKVAKPVCKLSLPASNLVVPIFKVPTPDYNDLVPA